jgi:pentapeptide repeat protein
VTKNLELTEAGQVTERFTKAITQLGDDKLQIRLGGIYALERIAKDSAKDHWPIMEVLTTYIRENAPWLPKEIQPWEGDQLPEEELPATQKQPLPKLVTDIQAVLTVLGRRTQTYEKEEEQRLNLAMTDLRGASLRQARLEGASLGQAQLKGATNLTVEQLSTMKTLYQAYLDSPLLEQIKQRYPHLLKAPQ